MAPRHPRLRTQYSLHKTNTGRLASGRDPSDEEKVDRLGKVAQIHNIPKRLRDMFVADPGWVMINGDWSAIQWALCMYLAAGVNDPPGYHLNLLEQHQAGELDPHVFLAKHYAKTDNVSEGERQTAKGYTYGRMFKGKPSVLAMENRHSPSVGAAVCAAHDEAYKLQPWWNDVLGFVERSRFVETPDGWRRYFFNPLRRDKSGAMVEPKPQEILASLIQGTEAGMLKYCLLKAFETRPPWAEILTTVHDSILIQVEKAHLEEGEAWLRGVLESPIPFLGNRAFKSDCSSGANWLEASG